MNARLSIPVRPTPSNTTIGASGTLALFGSAALPTRVASVSFDQDSVLRWISIVTNVRLSNANAFGTIIVAFDDAITVNDANAANGNAGIIWQNTAQQTVNSEIITPNSVQIDMDYSYIRAGVPISLYFHGAAAAPGNVVISASVSLAYNTLSEWVNFMQPNVGFRA